MKIESGRGVSPASGARRAGQVAAPGFAPAAEGPQRVFSVAASAPVTGLDALMALQAHDPERRRRQIKRGGAALDALEELARGLALGRPVMALVADLDHLRGRAETTGEAGLDAALLEIDTRLAVELAKLDLALERPRSSPDVSR